MDTPSLLRDLRQCVGQIPEIMGIAEGIHHPKVKSWRSRVFSLLKEGGSTCERALRSMKNLGLESIPLEDTFVNRQSYLSQLEAMQNILNQTIQTIEVLGRPEDREQLPNWGKPRSSRKAHGSLMIGDQEVDPASITIVEVLDCLVSYIQETNDLTEEMRAEMLDHLLQVRRKDLFQPFLGHRLNDVLSHWK